MTENKDIAKSDSDDGNGSGNRLKDWHCPKIIMLDSVNKITKGGLTNFTPKEAPPVYKIS